MLEIFQPVVPEDDVWLYTANRFDALTICLTIFLYRKIWQIETLKIVHAENSVGLYCLSLKFRHARVTIGKCRECFVAVAEADDGRLAALVDKFTNDPADGDDGIIEMTGEHE